MNEYYKNLNTYEDFDAHKRFVLNAVEQKDRLLVEKAIKIVEEYHNTPRTLYKGNYNRHPVRVARILLEEFDVKDVKTVLIALCHDLGEWTNYEVNTLNKEFGIEVMEGVQILTWNHSAAWEEFFNKIILTGNDSLITVKIADKLDNNRAAAFSDKKEKLKAKEKTELTVRPFVEHRFPEYWEKLKESLEAL